MTRHLGLLFFAALVLLGPSGVSRAEEAPLAPLTAVARHLDAGVAAFLAGKSPAEAFAPWKVEGTEEETSKLREDLQKAGVASAKSFHLDFELDYVKGDMVVYRLRCALSPTPERVVLLEVMNGGRETGPVSSVAIPLDSAAPALRPFVDAAKALDAAVRAGGEALPFVDLGAIHTLLGDVFPLEQATAVQERAREYLKRAGSEVQALAPDRVMVRVDDQGFLAFDAAGKPLGTLGAEFEPMPDGRLVYRLKGFRRFPDKAARASARRAMAEAHLRQLSEAVSGYHALNGKLPATLEDLTRPDPRTNEPYLEVLPKDPWGQPYRYAVRDAQTFIISSYGEDLKEGTPDDLTWPK